MMNEKRVYICYDGIEEGDYYIKFIKPDRRDYGSDYSWWEAEVYGADLKFIRRGFHVPKWVEKDKEYERVPKLKAKLLGLL